MVRSRFKINAVKILSLILALGFFTRALALPAPVPPSRFSFYLGPRLYFSRIDSLDRSNGGKATFLSNMNIAVDWSIARPFGVSKKLLSIVYGNFALENYADANNGFAKYSHITKAFGFGKKYILTPKFGLMGKIGYTEEAFSRAIAQGLYAVDAVPEGKFEILAGYSSLFSASLVYLDGTFGLALYTPQLHSSYHGQFGEGYLIKLDVKKNLNYSQIRCGIYFKERFQGTNLIEQTMQEVGLMAGVKWWSKILIIKLN